MTTPATGEAARELTSSTCGLEREQLIRAFRLMYMSRRIDDREILLKRQNKIFFQISAAGHEAIQIAAGMVLRAALRLVLSLLSRPRSRADARRDRRTTCCCRPSARQPIPRRAAVRCRRTGARRSCTS